MTKTELTSQELFEKMQPAFQETYTAQLLSDGLSVNMSDIYSTLIKEAARCNSYNSDVVYDINYIHDKLKEYRGGNFEPIFVGFRKYGVDGTSYILSRMEDYSSPYLCLSREYFVVYSVTLNKTEYEGFYNIVFSKYWT